MRESRFNLNSMADNRNNEAGPSRAKIAWDRRWERYFMALKQANVEPGFHEFYRGWIWGFIKAIKSKELREAESNEATRATEAGPRPSLIKGR